VAIEAPREAGANRQDGNRVGSSALLQICEDPLSAVSGGFFRFLDHLVLGFASFRPQIVFQAR
jgi:hypothetical protein